MSKEIPFYAIYCREIEGRKHETDRHLRNHGIEPNWFEGIHGVTFGLQTTHECAVDGKSGWRISPGQVGLDLGHYMVWSHIWHSGYENAVIMEDDVVVVPNFKDKFDRVMQELPSDYDICFLGWLDTHPRIKTQVNGLVHKLNDIAFGTHCYVVSRNGVRKLLDTNRICWGHIDVQIHRRTLGNAKWYACSPSLAAQRSQGGNWKGTV